MMNSVNIVGRLTKDVDLRYSQSGKAIANFTIASNRPFKNNGKQEADFINTVQFGPGSENTANYMKKGSLVGVTGRIQTRTYENKENKTVFVTEVVAENVAFLESKKTSEQSNKTENVPPSEGQPIDPGDDLPF